MVRPLQERDTVGGTSRIKYRARGQGRQDQYR